MTIEREEIEKLATLSRLAIDEKTIADVTGRLSSVSRIGRSTAEVPTLSHCRKYLGLSTPLSGCVMTK